MVPLAVLGWTVEVRTESFIARVSVPRSGTPVPYDRPWHDPAPRSENRLPGMGTNCQS
jgi:hypothetical protein